MIPTRRFDLIAFDWDGTLFDSTALIVRSLQDACRDIGVAVPDAARAAYVIGLGLRDALEYAVPGLPSERYSELAASYRRHYLGGQQALTLFTGTIEMLRALKARQHLLAVATGKNRRGLDDVLQMTELRGLFDASRTADETVSKPHPLMLQELMAELGTAPERTLMVGDTTHDLQMAVNAGTPCVGVSFGAHDHESFEPFAPLAIAHSTRELHDWLVANA
ncbi:MAG TPA: HAD-IA family hydrolase [Ideonella sp.]|jgi:phosphoglycolate phosphatase|nr:HAD-IA family hydrolase [Ideonella sp.]